LGLIDTQPFSMVEVLAVQFKPGPKLTTASRSNAVGGLVGINRISRAQAHGWYMALRRSPCSFRHRPRDWALHWGDDPPPSPDVVSPVDIVVEALRDAASWRSLSPGQGDRVARLRDATVPDHGLVHPLGSFEVRQTRVPLKVGANPVAENRVNLGEPLVDGRSVAAVSTTTDRFAPGQFLDLTDDQKLSTPTFEDMPSGMRFTGVAGTRSGPRSAAATSGGRLPREGA
jgi:hypothetical protein